MLAGALASTACSGDRTVVIGSPGGPLSPTGDVARRQVLAAQYMEIALEGNHRLDIDFDGLSGRDGGNLAAARADLRDAAATERRFDSRLLRIPFPPRLEVLARALVAVNEDRAALTAAAAASSSLPVLRGDMPMLTAANAPVEEYVAVIRSQLGLPPPDTS